MQDDANEGTPATRIVSFKTVRGKGIRTHVTYVVEVDRGQGSISFVYRRYSAFADLLKQLRRRFPRSDLPKMPSKRVARSFNASYLEKKQEQLDQFLGELLAVPEAAASPEMARFLRPEGDADAEAPPVEGEDGGGWSDLPVASELELELNFLLQAAGRREVTLRKDDPCVVALTCPPGHAVVWEFTFSRPVGFSLSCDGRECRPYTCYTPSESPVRDKFFVPRGEGGEDSGDPVVQLRWEHDGPSLTRTGSVPSLSALSPSSSPVQVSFCAEVVDPTAVEAAREAARDVRARSCSANVTAAAMSEPSHGTSRSESPAAAGEDEGDMASAPAPAPSATAVSSAAAAAAGAGASAWTLHSPDEGRRRLSARRGNATLDRSTSAAGGAHRGEGSADGPGDGNPTAPMERYSLLQRISELEMQLRASQRLAQERLEVAEKKEDVDEELRGVRSALLAATHEMTETRNATSSLSSRLAEAEEELVRLAAQRDRARGEKRSLAARVHRVLGEEAAAVVAADDDEEGSGAEDVRESEAVGEAREARRQCAEARREADELRQEVSRFRAEAAGRWVGTESPDDIGDDAEADARAEARRGGRRGRNESEEEGEEGEEEVSGGVSAAEVARIAQEADDRVQQAEERAAAAEARAAAAQARVDEAETRAEEAKHALQRARAEMSDLRERASRQPDAAAAAAAKAAQEEAAALRDRVRTLREQVRDAEDLTASAQEERMSMRAALESAAQGRRTAEERAVELQGQRKVLVSEVKGLRQKLATALEERKEAMRQTNEALRSLDALRAASQEQQQKAQKAKEQQQQQAADSGSAASLGAASPRAVANPGPHSPPGTPERSLSGPGEMGTTPDRHLDFSSASKTRRGSSAIFTGRTALINLSQAAEDATDGAEVATEGGEAVEPESPPRTDALSGAQRAEESGGGGGGGEGGGAGSEREGARGVSGSGAAATETPPASPAVAASEPAAQEGYTTFDGQRDAVAELLTRDKQQVLIRVCSGQEKRHRVLSAWLRHVVLGAPLHTLDMKAVEVSKVPHAAAKAFVQAIGPLLSRRPDIDVHLTTVPVPRSSLVLLRIKFVEKGEAA